MTGGGMQQYYYNSKTRLRRLSIFTILLSFAFWCCFMFVMCFFIYATFLIQTIEWKCFREIHQSLFKFPQQRCSETVKVWSISLFYTNVSINDGNYTLSECWFLLDIWTNVRENKRIVLSEKTLHRWSNRLEILALQGIRTV